MTLFLTILLWLAWSIAVAAGSVATLFVAAFGDAPHANRAVQRAITPVMAWIIGVVILGGLSLVRMREWWSIALAFVLALSPPVVMLAIVTMLMRWGNKH